MKTLCYNATIITMDKERRILHNSAVLIEEDKIIAIGEYLDLLKQCENAMNEIDLSGGVILPGFIDAHSHAGHSFFASVVKDTAQWMLPLTHMYKNYVNDDFWYHEARLAALQRVHFGVTTSINVMGSQSRCDEFSYAKAQTDGYAELGLRNILCVGPNAGPWPHRLSSYDKEFRIRKNVQYEEAINVLEHIVRGLNGTNDGLTKVYITPFQILCSLSGETSSDMIEYLSEEDKRNSYEMRRISSKYNTRIHTDGFKGMVHLAYQDQNALLGPDVHLQHLNGITVDEVEILAKTKTNVSYAPHIGQFKSRTPIIELMNAGVKVAISTDGASYNAGFDLFTAMRKTQWMTRAIYQERNYLPCEKLLEMVTIDAAEVIGYQTEIGSIEVGKKADMMFIDMNKPHLTPHFNLINQIVRMVQPSDIIHLMVNGKFVLYKGEVMLADEKNIMECSQKQAEKIIGAAHLDSFAYPDKYFWGEVQAYYEKKRYDVNWQKEDGGYYG